MKLTWFVAGICVLALAPDFVRAQEVIDITRSCPLYREGFTDDVYAFRSDQQTGELFDRIIALSGNPQGIKLLAANVPSALAVIEGEQRLVLYNTDFVYPVNPPPGHELEVLAMLAHAVGHHVLGHSLTAEGDWQADELAADQYAGGVLAQLADDSDQVVGRLQRDIVLLEASVGPASEERRRALLDGWEEINTEYTTNPGTGYETGNGGSDNEGIPQLPWPPPRASARVRIPLAVNTPDATLSDIAEVIETAFYAAGYGDFSYLAVPEGFAMVSQLEQIHEDGTPLAVPDRWSTRVRPFTEFSLSNYMRALFRATPGHFRIIVFVVTPVPFTQSDEQVAADEAEAWLAWGLDALPSEIGNLLVTEDTKTSVLVYEFVKPTRDDDVEFRSPGTLPAASHLQRARLWESLGL